MHVLNVQEHNSTSTRAVEERFKHKHLPAQLRYTESRNMHGDDSSTARSILVKVSRDVLPNLQTILLQTHFSKVTTASDGRTCAGDEECVSTLDQGAAQILL